MAQHSTEQESSNSPATSPNRTSTTHDPKSQPHLDILAHHGTARTFQNAGDVQVAQERSARDPHERHNAPVTTFVPPEGKRSPDDLGDDEVLPGHHAQKHK
ncbi:hypothetical protein BKA81DRAFT_402810 [Phyllosticta paracitricarpa]